MALLKCDYYSSFPIENVRSEGDSASLVTVDDHSVLMAHAKMPKKGRGKAASLDPLSLPVELQTALETL
jgi:hypothetical protein